MFKHFKIQKFDTPFFPKTIKIEIKKLTIFRIFNSLARSLLRTIKSRYSKNKKFDLIKKRKFNLFQHENK